MPDTTTPRTSRAYGASKRSLLLALFSLAFMLIFLTAYVTVKHPALAQSGLESRGQVYTVERVVDGDTIEVSPDINGESVRLIGIDTPESVDPNQPPQPFGEEAADFTAEQLEGRQVALEFGQEDTDRFGRSLAYVWTSGDELFNETLVRQGYAQVATFEPNTKYEENFLRAQDAARSEELGIWGLPPEEQCQLTNHGNGIGEGSEVCSEESGTREDTAQPEGPGSTDPEVPRDETSPPAERPQEQPRVGATVDRPDETSSGRTPATGGPSPGLLAGALVLSGAGVLLLKRLLR